MYNDSYKVDYGLREISPSIDPLFAERWSPRSFKKQTLKREDIDRLGEALRWSPSSYNLQPWRVIVAENGTPEFDAYMQLLVEFNQQWVKNASLLGFFIASLYDDDGNLNHTTAFDTGFAWAALTFQARALGLYTHGMSGVDYEASYGVLNVNKDKYAVQAAFAVGVLADKSELDNEKMREMELPHGMRKPRDQIFFLGSTDRLQ